MVLNSEASEEKKLLDFARIEVTKTGLSEFARRLQVDASNLNKIVQGKRKLSRQLAVKFERYLGRHRRVTPKFRDITISSGQVVQHHHHTSTDATANVHIVVQITSL